MSEVDRYEKIQQLLSDALVLADTGNENSDDDLLYFMIDNAREELRLKMGGARKRRYDPKSSFNAAND